MIFERIRQAYPLLTKSHQRVADYLAVSYREVAFLTASQLAERLGMNEATVIRFAQRIGYRGYPEMMADITHIVREELSLGARPAPEEEMLGRHVWLEMERAQRVLRHLPKDLPALWEKVCEARRIYALGQGISAGLAQWFAYGLRCLRLPVESLWADSLSLRLILSELNEGCAVFAITLDPESGEMAYFLQRAREQGAWTLAFVSTATSACALAAEEVILCGEEGTPSFGAAMLVLEAILQGIRREMIQSAALP